MVYSRILVRNPTLVVGYTHDSGTNGKGRRTGTADAVTAAFGNSYGAVGNQTTRTIGDVAYTQTFDDDNRLVAVSGGSVSAASLYDADGNRVKETMAGVTTVYIAGLYEWQNPATTKYYEGGALRRTGYASQNGVFYSLSDHLNSTSVLVNQNGTVNGRNYFYPYGGNRNGAFSGLTTKRFTGQYHESGLPGGEGLYYYNARWYDARLARFVSADTIVPNPGNPQALNRYSYVLGNPLRFVDPTGHAEQCADGDICGSITNSTNPAYLPYGIHFTSDSGVAWDSHDVQQVLYAAQAISARLASATRSANFLAEKTGSEPVVSLTSSSAFASVFGQVTFHRSATSCRPDECWAETLSAHSIRLYTDTPSSKYGVTLGGYTYQNATHELGHAFDLAVGRRGSMALNAAKIGVGNEQVAGGGWSGGYVRFKQGFATDSWEWQQNPAANAVEEFADMFLGWTYDHFAKDAFGAARYAWMNTSVPFWLR